MEARRWASLAKLVGVSLFRIARTWRCAAPPRCVSILAQKLQCVGVLQACEVADVHAEHAPRAGRCCARPAAGHILPGHRTPWTTRPPQPPPPRRSSLSSRCLEGRDSIFRFRRSSNLEKRGRKGRRKERICRRMVYCHNCGTKAVAGGKFCQMCGTPLAGAPPASQPPYGHDSQGDGGESLHTGGRTLH